MPNRFIVDLESYALSDIERVILKHPQTAGVLLFTCNFKESEQLKHLTQSIKDIRSDLFIAVDHEGGIVQRFQRHGFRTLPPARIYGDVFNLNKAAGLTLAKQYAHYLADDLIQHGIDLSMAPVLDLDGNSKIIGQLGRAFHDNPDAVIQLASAFIDGMHEAGMPSVAKHFPGHGRVIEDSHTTQPICNLSLETLKSLDLKPFASLINTGHLDAIMPAYVTYPAIDQHPAGFSKRWLHDILRGEFQFEGLLISDCLGMTGADIGDLNIRSQKALEAGCDLLIVSHQTRADLLALLDSINDPTQNTSQARLLAFKSRMKKMPQTNTSVNQTLNTMNTDSTCKSESSHDYYNKTTSI